MPRLPSQAPFAAAVADLPADQQGLLVVLDGPPHLAQVRIRQAQVAQMRALAAAVAERAPRQPGQIRSRVLLAREET